MSDKLHRTHNFILKVKLTSFTEIKHIYLLICWNDPIQLMKQKLNMLYYIATCLCTTTYEFSLHDFDKLVIS